MINLVFAASPLLFGLLLIMKTGNVNKSMLYSALLGSALYSVKNCRTLITIEPEITAVLMIHAVCRSCLQTVSECLRLVRGIIIDKTAIFAAVFVLFLMVKLICSSCVLEYINRAAERHITSRWRFLAFIIGLSLLFSIDDYLCCVGVSAVSAGIAVKHNISREKAAYTVCLLALAFCTVLPHSSWNPVICAAINNSVPSASVLQMNLAAFFFLSITVAEVLASYDHKQGSLQKAGKLPGDARQVFGVLIATAASTASALVVVNHLTDGTWSVAAAGTAGCFVLVTAGVKCRFINMKIILSGLRGAAADTVSLFKMLFLVWMVKDICIEMLGLSTSLTETMTAAAFPPYMVPGIVYLVSAGFGLMTGTSFGAFSLFIPLATGLAGDSGECLRSAAEAAALAGSLQSVNRPGSDVIRLASGVLNCDEKNLMGLQKHFAALTNPILFISFSLAGLCAGLGAPAMFTAGMAPLIIISVILYAVRRGAVREKYRAPGMAATMGIPYGRKFRTFWQKCNDLEVLYAAFLIGIRQKARSLFPVNFI